jgi:hypothetical protein
MYELPFGFILVALCTFGGIRVFVERHGMDSSEGTTSICKHRRHNNDPDCPSHNYLHPPTVCTANAVETG